uniref:Putative truncated MFS-type transporter n=1 Tax=hospital metagenome TaxID=1755691 RepID=A0A4P9D4L6_9ZZZZ
MILAATTLLTPSLGVIQAAQVAGLLYVWRNLVQVAVSYPVGVLADRVGHLPVLIAGYVLGTLTAVLTALAFWLGIASVPLLAGVFFIAGLYVAVQEALESTVTAEMVQPDTLAMSYGALGTVNGAAKLISSASVGVVWTAVSPVVGFGLAAALMAAGTLILLRVQGNWDMGRRPATVAYLSITGFRAGRPQIGGGQTYAHELIVERSCASFADIIWRIHGVECATR